LKERREGWGGLKERLGIETRRVEDQNLRETRRGTKRN